MIELFKNPNYDFIGKRKWAYLFSARDHPDRAGLARHPGGLRYDIDFTGGTLVQVRFEQPPAIAEIRAGLAAIQLGDAIIQEFGTPASTSSGCR